MGFLGGGSEPGAAAFHACPHCGEDAIYSRKDGVLSKTRYFCDHCEREASGEDVRKTFSDFYREARADRGDDSSEDAGGENGHQEKSFVERVQELRGPGVDDITNPELREQVEDRQAEGWDVEEVTESGTRVVMSTTKGGTIGGHALTGVLTGLWTFGMGNVAYSKLSKKKNRERIVLRADGDSDSVRQSDAAGSPIDAIRELKRLNDDGVITDDEFEAKKRELLEEV